MEKTLKILMLEDSVVDAEIIQQSLLKKRPNCEFKLVMTEQDYQAALNGFQPDVILSDNTLPQFDATKALEIFNQRSLPIPFILVTGTVSEEFAAGIIKLGADDYILKDRLVRLPAAIDAALKKRRFENEKLEAQRDLAQSEEKYRTLFLKSPLSKWIYDQDTLQFLDVNEAAIKLYGYSREEFLDMTIKDIRPEEDVELLLNDVKKAVGTDTRQGQWRHRKKNGELILVETIAHSFDYLNRKTRMVVAIDITEKIKSEEHLRLMEKKILDQKIEEQKKIARAMIKAQEEEKNRIGQELHDNINQILAGTKIYLSIAAKKDEIVKELVKYPMELIDSSIEEIRLLSRKQVTPLKNIDLEELVRELLSNLDQNAMQVNFSYEVSNKLLSDDLKLSIYRIIQEQLNNILKHADAKHATIAIKTKDNTISICVDDDGKGFDVKRKRKGIGISNMINRVETFNGWVEIRSNPGEGCKIIVSIPY